MQPTQPDPLAKYKPTTAEEAAKIFPRAEFRVFGRDIVEGVKERMWNAKAQLKGIRDMPEEVYFLSRNTNDVNVKVRGGLRDSKT